MKWSSNCNKIFFNFAKVSYLCSVFLRVFFFISLTKIQNHILSILFSNCTNFVIVGGSVDKKGTANRIQDSFILSSIKPKFDNWFFVDLMFCTWNCSTNSANQNKNNFIFVKPCILLGEVKKSGQSLDALSEIQIWNWLKSRRHKGFLTPFREKCLSTVKAFYNFPHSLYITTVSF